MGKVGGDEEPEGGVEGASGGCAGGCADGACGGECCGEQAGTGTCPCAGTCTCAFLGGCAAAAASPAVHASGASTASSSAAAAALTTVAAAAPSGGARAALSSSLSMSSSMRLRASCTLTNPPESCMQPSSSSGMIMRSFACWLRSSTRASRRARKCGSSRRAAGTLISSSTSQVGRARGGDVGGRAASCDGESCDGESGTSCCGGGEDVGMS